MLNCGTRNAHRFTSLIAGVLLVILITLPLSAAPQEATPGVDFGPRAVQILEGWFQKVIALLPGEEEAEQEDGDVGTPPADGESMSPWPDPFGESGPNP